MSKTLFEAYNETKKELENAGIEDYVFEAKQIVKHLTGFTNAEILQNYNMKLSEFQLNNLTAIIKQRLIRYPLQYILGNWSFFGRNFSVGPGVLIPRSDTETVMDVCLEFLKEKVNPEILDLCCGSGCIGITIALEKEGSSVSLLEKYEDAARYSAKNIADNNAYNATLFMGDVTEGDLNGKKYDLIVSNPPYLTPEDMLKTQPELKFEPETALYGGEDGLLFYRIITENYKDSLKGGGMLCFEVGINQSKQVKKILEDNRFENVNIRKDLNGIDRVVFGTVK